MNKTVSYTFDMSAVRDANIFDIHHSEITLDVDLSIMPLEVTSFSVRFVSERE